MLALLGKDKKLLEIDFRWYTELPVDKSTDSVYYSKELFPHMCHRQQPRYRQSAKDRRHIGKWRKDKDGDSSLYRRGTVSPGQWKPDAW